MAVAPGFTTELVDWLVVWVTEVLGFDEILLNLSLDLLIPTTWPFLVYVVVTVVVVVVVRPPLDF